MLSGGIAHTTFGGIGLGYFLGIEPIISGLFFSIIASLGISRINKKTDTYSDLLIGMFWSLGMAFRSSFYCFYARLSSRYDLIPFRRYLNCFTQGIVTHAYF